MLLGLVDQPLCHTLNLVGCLSFRGLGFSELHRLFRKWAFLFYLSHFSLLESQQAIVLVARIISDLASLGFGFIAPVAVICLVVVFLSFLVFILGFEHAKELVLPWKLLNRRPVSCTSNWFVSIFVDSLIKRLELSAEYFILLGFFLVSLARGLGVAWEHIVLHLFPQLDLFLFEFFLGHLHLFSKVWCGSWVPWWLRPTLFCRQFCRWYS